MTPRLRPVAGAVLPVKQSPFAPEAPQAASQPLTLSVARLPAVAQAAAAAVARTVDNDGDAIAVAFDLLMFNGDDMRRKPFIGRKAALGKLLFRSRDGIQYVEHAEDHGDKLFAAVCKLGLEGIVSKKLNAPYKSGHQRRG